MNYSKILLLLTGLLLWGGAGQAGNTFSLQIPDGVTQQVVEAELILDNPDAAAAFQIDIVLPEGVVYQHASISLNELRATTNHDIDASLVNDNTLRIIAWALPSANFNGNSGVIARFDVQLPSQEGTFTFSPEGVILSDIDGEGLEVSASAVMVEVNTPPDPVNELIIHDAEVPGGEQAIIDVAIDNEQPFSAFQFDIPLPEGFSFLSGSAQLSGRETNHALQTNVVGDKIRFLAYSSNNETFYGSDGNVLSFSLNTPYTEGIYTLQPQDVSIVDAEGNNILTGIVNGNVILTEPIAEFYDLTLSVQGNGTTQPAPGAHTYVEESQVEITAIADAGNHFVKWVIDEVDVTENPTTVTMSADINAVAHFQKNIYTITALAESGGSIDPSGEVAAEHGDDVMFSIDPDAGYRISEVIVDEENVGTPSQYTFSNITADASITARFEVDADGPNVFVVKDVESYMGEMITVFLEIENADPFIGFETHIALPEGFVYVNESIQLEGREADHEILANVDAQNIMNIAAYSATNAEFTESEGIVASFQLQTPMVAGLYSLEPEETIIVHISLENILTTVVGSQVNLLKSVPEVTQWPEASDITFGQSLADSELTGGEASIDGEFVFANPELMPDAGFYEDVEVVFIPTDTDNYIEVQGTVSITVSKAPATIIISETTHVYNGQPKDVAVTTQPEAFDYIISYDGQPGAPTDAGTYDVLVVIDDDNYEGEETDILVIGKAPAQVFLSQLVHTWDDTPKEAVATTQPQGLNVVITYDGSQDAPSAVGEYDVVATIDEINYQGSVSDVFIINTKDTPQVTWAQATAIQYGETLAASSLQGGNATHNGDEVPGDFSFDDPAFSPGVGVHSVQIVFTPEDKDAFNIVKGFIDITVNKADAQIIVSQTQHVFDGNPKEVEVETVPAGLTVVITYNGSEHPPVDAGSYDVELEIIDDNYIGSASATLVIEKADPEIITWPEASAIVYGDALSRSVLSGGEAAVEGVFDFAQPDLELEAGMHDVEVVFTPVASHNYNVVTAEVEIQVLKAAAQITITDLEQIFTGEPLGVTVTTNPPGLDYILTYNGQEVEPSEVGVYDVVVLIVNDNYEGEEEAQFEIVAPPPPPTYQLSLTASPEGAGTFTGEGEYEEGELVTITTQVEEGYIFVNWKHNGTEISTEKDFTYTMPADDVELTAYFVEIPSENIVIVHDVTAYAGDEITMEVEVQNEDAFVAFQMDFQLPDDFILVEGSVKLTDRAAGHSIAHNILSGNRLRVLAFSLSNAEFAGEDGVLFTFALQTSEQAGEYVMEAMNVSLTSSNSQNVFTESVAGLITLEEPLVPSYSLSIVVEPADAGAVTGEGAYTEGEEITLSATAGEGYRFLGWIQGNVEIGQTEELLFVMPAENVTLTAQFTPTTAVGELSLSDVRLFPNPNRGRFTIEAPISIYRIEVYNLTGQQVLAEEVNAFTRELEIAGAEPGIYFVKIFTAQGTGLRKLQIIP